MSNIKLFESKQIRSQWDAEGEKWYFSVQDVVVVLTDSADIKQNINKMLSRDEQIKSNWGTICTLVEMAAADGKKRKVRAAENGNIKWLYKSNKVKPIKLVILYHDTTLLF